MRTTAKKRKVDNLMALAVLSTVVQRPMHRYEMATIMRARNKDQDMAIKWGSLYTVVQNLEKHGFLQATGNDRQGSRPERTIYEITDAGRHEMIDWTRELLAEPETEHPRFGAGLSVLAALGPDDAIDLLTTRLTVLERTAAAQRSAMAENLTEIPRLFLIESEYSLALLEAEILWVRSVLEEMTEGTFPGLDMWRAFQATGELPEELIEISERGATPT